MKQVHKIFCAILCALTSGAAWSHHSAAAFDRSKSVAMIGTIKEFRWVNPHTWLQIAVPNDQGGVDTWIIEGPAISLLARSGWNGKTLAPGDKVRLLVAPYRDGSQRGEFMAVAKDGKYLKF